jgi:oxygen-independent coproporphyrinogen-3 oxidase
METGSGFASGSPLPSLGATRSKNMSTRQHLGLYLSVPFCRHKCSFCNFASGVGSDEAIDGYIAQLCEEISQAQQTASALNADLPATVDTVYFGGGTPSLLTPGQFARIFQAIRERFQITPHAEITLEAAPGQMADDTLAAALEQGVNRVSLGVQSFIDRESRAVGRHHTGVSCLAEIARLQSAGMRDVGVDLIAGLPYQTLASFTESLEMTARTALTHLSVYMLEVDEDSRLGREVLAGGLRLHAPAVASDDQSAAMYELACDWLPAHGFAQYEISNFARSGFQSRHNRKYWRRAPYLGLGLDAHSMLLTRTGAVRFANPDSLAAYAAGSPKEVTIVGRTEAFEESLFLGLRLLEGVSIEGLREQFADLLPAAEASLPDLLSEGLVEATTTHWRLTQRGRVLSNEVFGRLLEAVPA